jgi:hypothetical protein
MKKSTIYLLTLLVFACSESYAQTLPTYVSTDSLIAWYPFTGNTLDSSGNSFDLNNNNATPTSDRYGISQRAYNFNGNSYLYSNAFNQISGGSEFTVSAWLKPASNSGVGWWIAFGSSANGQGFHSKINSSNLKSRFWLYNYNVNLLPSVTINSAWNHIVVKYQGNKIYQYLNGVLATMDTVDYTVVNISSGVLQLGKQITFSEYYIGQIDDVGLWNRALSDCEIQALFDTPNQTLINVQSCQTYTSSSGNIYNASGTYLDTLASSSGCDSIIQIDLTILNPTYDTIVLSGCDLVVNPFNSDTVLISGQYVDTLVNAAGCDSIVTLNATILNSSANTDYQIACDSLLWLDGLTYYSNNNTATYIISNASGCDSIISLDLTIYSSAFTTEVYEACSEFTWINGVTYYESTNSESVTLATQNGCDSLVTLDLTINQVDTTVISSPPSLEAIANEALYQWLNCQTLELIENATEKVFIAEENGYYAVIVTQNFCTDTSNCFNISNVGVKNLYRNQVSIYPNPGSEQLHIESEGNFEYRIFNSVGSMVLKGTGFGSEKIDLANIENGYYSIEVIGANYNESRSIIVSK